MERYRERENRELQKLTRKRAVSIAMMAAVILCAGMLVTAPVGEALVVALVAIGALVVGAAIGAWIVASTESDYNDQTDPAQLLLGGESAVEWDSYSDACAALWNNSWTEYETNMAIDGQLINATYLTYGRYGQAMVLAANLLNTTIWGAWDAEEDFVVSSTFYDDMGDMLFVRNSRVKGAANNMIYLQGRIYDLKQNGDSPYYYTVSYKYSTTWYLISDGSYTSTGSFSKLTTVTKNRTAVGVALRDGMWFYGSVLQVLTAGIGNVTLTLTYRDYNTSSDIKYVENFRVEAGGRGVYTLILPERGWWYFNAASDPGGVLSGVVLMDGLPYITDTTTLNMGIFVPTANGLSEVWFMQETWPSGTGSYYVEPATAPRATLEAGFNTFITAFKNVDGYIRASAQTFRDELVYLYNVNDVSELPEDAAIVPPDVAFPNTDEIFNLNTTQMMALIWAYLIALNETIQRYNWTLNPDVVQAPDMTTMVRGTIIKTTDNGTAVVNETLVNNSWMFIMPTGHDMLVVKNTSQVIDQWLYVYEYLPTGALKLWNIYGTPQTRATNVTYTLYVANITVNGVEVNSTVIRIITVSSILTEETEGAAAPGVVDMIVINFGAILAWITDNPITAIFAGLAVISLITAPRNKKLFYAAMFGILAVAAYYLIEPAIDDVGTAIGWLPW